MDEPGEAVRLCANPVQTGDELDGGRHSLNKQGGRLARFFKRLIIARLAQDIALSPNCINAQALGAIFNEFAPQLANKDVDDFWFWFINAAIKMVQKSVFAENSPFSWGQKLNDPEFFGG